MKPMTLGLAAILSAGLASVGLADDLRTTERFDKTIVGFEVGGPYRNVTLTITGPNDFDASAFSARGAPSIDLRRFGAVEDGTYAYQLSAASDERATVRSKLDNGRAPGAAAPLKSISASGTFSVKGGVIVARGAAGKRDRNPR